MDEIKKIYENKVIPFENTDDSYKSKMSAYYSEWSSMGDKFSDAGNAIKDFMTGVWDSLAGTVMGLLTIVADLGILYADAKWKSIVPIQVPEVLDQEVEKIKQKYEPLLKDPVNTIGGIGQSICDTADEKGVAYSSGYIVTEVVTALLADKGLDKIKNVAKTGKTADNVADIAEGAVKGAESAADDAGKAGKGLEGAAKGAESAAEDAGKVVEGGSVPDFYAGPNGKALPSQYKDWIGTNIQKELLEQAENPQLQNAIKQLYRGNSFIGDGGTADVIRFEQQTGLMLGKNGGSHIQKGIDMAKYIENKVLTQDLSLSDRALATQLLEDLYSALGR